MDESSLVATANPPLFPDQGGTFTFLDAIERSGSRRADDVEVIAATR